MDSNISGLKALINLPSGSLPFQSLDNGLCVLSLADYVKINDEVVSKLYLFISGNFYSGGSHTAVWSITSAGSRVPGVVG